MKFYGFQKMTMLDYPGLVACTLFTAGCNFRCPFCHNAPLVTEITGDDVHTEEDVLAYLTKRKGIIEGVCITGGEPLLHSDLASFIQKLKSLGLKVKLDTNGSDPVRLKQLIDGGLIDYVAMDIKNCSEKYGVTIGADDFDMAPIRESILLLKEGKIPYEFRTTVVPEFHTAQDMEKLAEMIEGAEHYYLQQFVDSGNVIMPNLHAYAPGAMGELLEIVKKYVPNAQLRGL